MQFLRNFGQIQSQSWLIVMIAIRLCACYLLIVSDLSDPGTIIFNSSLGNEDSERKYQINWHKTAHFVRNLIKVNKTNGQVTLKKSLMCNGIRYPNLFTVYVDSETTHATMSYFCRLPIRLYIIGKKCKFNYQDWYATLNTKRYTSKLDNINGTNLNEYTELAMAEAPKRYNTAIRERSRIERNYILRTIDGAKYWSSETFVSYTIYGENKWNPICLRRTQLISNLSSFLPRTVKKYCIIRFMDPSDPRLKIETVNEDLVANKDVCITEPLWIVMITFNIQCSNKQIINSDHRLKIVYHHHEFNDTDIATRVRRELINRSPYFEQGIYIASVEEENSPGIIVTTVQAIDPESSSVVYTMTSLLDSRSQSMFKIDSQSGSVSTSVRMDRELIEVHYFRIIATDDSFPPRSGTTTLQINVLDCNDNGPVFEAENFEASIREGVTIGTTVITVRATDQDIGRNAEIEYNLQSISGGGLSTEEEDILSFQLDSTTGVITTNVDMDREKTDIYTIIVVASDSPKVQTEQKSATANIVVKILDENDNYPIFSKKIYNIQIKEDIWDNKSIAHLKATDADEGNNAAIRYAIIGGNTLSQFSIDSVTGEVSLVKPLDYENIHNFRLIIRAQDGGYPSKSNTTQLIVNVIDVNDNSPKFYVSQFQESVLENVPIGYNIIRIQAYDADDGDNAEIQYNIIEREEHFPLDIDSKLGWIQTVRKLDREQCSRYVFRVLAVDGGQPQKSASASVTIIIQDVNDNDPVFASKFYEACVSEDTPPGSPVITVIATDPDEHSRLHYDITTGNTRGRFSINVQNGKGVITIAQPLDYKQERRFILTVTASDSGGRMDVTIVNINVTDANNYAPVFDNSPYSANVLEDAAIGTTVLVVSATDNDVGLNSQISYSLPEIMTTGFSHNSAFSINSKTGAITTLKKLDRETTSAYLLTVKAVDGGKPSFSDTTDVEITVVDVNDNEPKFESLLYQTSISEDAPVGTSVIKIYAEDKDIDLNGRISFYFSEKDKEDGSFTIDPDSGVIRTNKALDRETTGVYCLNVIASDKGTPSLSSSVEVRIKLDDVNDSPPSFATDKIILYVKENSPIGTVIGNIEAHDPDEGANAVIHYSILSGDDAHLFSLISNPGSSVAQLLTMTELDYESAKKHFFIIIRAASPPLRNDAVVEILVTDVNDNAPVFKNFQVIFNNFESNFPLGEVARVPAFDPDVSDVLSYSVVAGNNANFIVLNASTGGIIFSPQLNTNVPRQAYIEISVSDGINNVRGVMHLIVRLITEEILLSSVTVSLNDMTEKAFLSPLLDLFLEGLSVILPCPKENIFLFSIQEDNQLACRILNISFSAMQPDVASEIYYSPKYLQERIYLKRDVLARLSTVEVLPFEDDLCVQEPCVNFEICSTVLKFGRASSFLHSNTILFRPIYPVKTFSCQCPYGFTGKKEIYMCDTEVDLCYSNPCQNNGKCIRREGGFTCACDTKYMGARCEKPSSSSEKCTDDACYGDNCWNGNLTSSIITQSAMKCQLNAISFLRKSFVTFETLRSRFRFNIKLKFATLNKDGLLFYNGRYNGLHDYIALQIIDGNVVFSISLGGSKKVLSIDKYRILSDGLWHTIEVDYFNRTVTLLVDGCDKMISLNHNFGEEWNCAKQTTFDLDARCSSPTESCYRFLDLTGPFQLGGVPDYLVELPIYVRSFIGCISDLYIDYHLVNLDSSISNNGSIAGCPQKAILCKSDPCFNGGICKERWNGFTCDCPEGFTGSSCQETTSIPWRFYENSTLVFNPLLRSIQLPWTIGLTMRTRKQNALLIQVQVGQNSSIVVALRNGNPIVVYESETLSFMTNLADGNWHRIDITWNTADIQLSSDYQRRATHLLTTSKMQGNFIGKIILGMLEKSLIDDTFPNFQGCIQNILIGGVQSIFNWPSLRKNVIDGCSSRSHCPKICPSNSLCVEKWDYAKCECTPGYLGDDCVHICALNPCVSGSCHLNSLDRKSYSCNCNSSLIFGEYCELKTEVPCPSGWWGEQSCGPCTCSEKRGYSKNCNKLTGQCYCKDFHYRPSNETSCFPCECYHVGSLSKTCNTLTGQCICRDGVIGRRCDTCSNPYAEVTLLGCETIYDACPRSFSDGIWWNRTALGSFAIHDCPKSAIGTVRRYCDSNTGRWCYPEMFNCTSLIFLKLKKQLQYLETFQTEISTFLAVKIAKDLKSACQSLSDKSFNIFNEIMLNKKTNESAYSKNEKWTFLTNELPSHDRFYGGDILLTEMLLHYIIRQELLHSGLNLSHSQDRNFVDNIASCASEILSVKYQSEWYEISKLTKRGAENLVEAFRKYVMILVHSQRDVFNKPFEVVHKNMVLGLDVITSESLKMYSTQFTQKYKENIYNKTNYIKANFATLKGIDPFSHDSIQYKYISLPKYDNFIQNTEKFDKATKALVPLRVFGMNNTLEYSHGFEMFECRPVVGYAQYKEAGFLFTKSFDETITKRWGVDVNFASIIFSLVVVNPTQSRCDYKKQFEIEVQNYQKTKNSDRILTQLNLGDKTNYPRPNTSSKEQILNTEKQKITSSQFSAQEKLIESQAWLYPILIRMRINISPEKFTPRLNPQCVRWSTEKGVWTRLGCQTEIPYPNELNEDVFVNCICTRLSSHSVLIDVNEVNEIQETMPQLKFILYSCFIFSLLALAIVLLSLTILRGARTNSNNIHQNIVLCIFCAVFLYFIGIQGRKTLPDNELSCKLLAILLHYAWLSTFVWISIDNIHIYRMLTEMRDINHESMTFYFSIGYGTPAVTVALAVGVRAHEYGNTSFCWLSMHESVIWWLIGPIFAMSVFNFIVLFRSIKSAFMIKEHILGFGNLRTLLLISVISLPLVCTMWILTVLLASNNSELLVVLLCITLSIYATFCMLAYCLLNQRVRDDLRRALFLFVGKKVPIQNSACVENKDVIKPYKHDLFNGALDDPKRTIGVSTSSTTSRSTTKTSSSAYR